MKLLTLSETSDLLRISVPTLWRLRKANASFPKTVQLSTQSIFFVASEIFAWLESHKSRGGA